MSQTTFANGRGIVHLASGGSSLVYPDVCKTPVGSALVPIPYPNRGRCSDGSKGPVTVRCEGRMPMVKNAIYTRSSGDEKGKGGGLLSFVNKGRCEFIVYSFDVKFENRGVCRLGDTLFHNKKNAMG